MSNQKYWAIALMSCLLPVATYAQDVKKDSTETNSKEVKNRNVMLNASSADQPRQISIGLPSSLSATIFHNGLPEAYATWPDMPYFSWFGGSSLGKMSVLSLSETALQYGAVGYTVNSADRHSGEKFQGTANYALNNYGRQSFDATISGPITNKLGYMVSSYQVWDPGTYKLDAARLQNRTQQYKVGLDYKFGGGRGLASLNYSYSRYTSNSFGAAPFIFVGDGSVKKYNGFEMGKDTYFPSEWTTFKYMDVLDGKIKEKSWKDIGTTTNHQVTFNLDYNFDNGMKLEVASKARIGKVNMGMFSATGITNNVPGNLFLKDGTPYNDPDGKVQNVWGMFVPGYERSWLTSAVLTGKSNNNRHSWRIGLNNWWNRAQVTQQNTTMAFVAEENPRALYTNPSLTVPTAPSTLEQVNAYNPGSGEYYNGHEHKIALFASDDWTLSRKLWMSLGFRLEYLGYSGHGYLNPKGMTFNSRTPGWNATLPGVQKTRFTGDWINPALAYNVRYTIAKGFGLVGEYVYVRQRPNLQDFAGSELPTTAPVNINMGRAGIFFNRPWIQLVSQVSFIAQTNYKSRSTFYHVLEQPTQYDILYPAGREVSVTQPITYNIQTMGWTTDFVLTPFKGFNFHGMLTIQKPVYKKFSVFADFKDGKNPDGTDRYVRDGADVSNNTVTAMSKVLIELDPSYSWKNWRVWLSFRYFSKQYINKTNTLYFNGRWESFGGINYTLNKHINFALNVVNIFNQTGASGSIGAADLVTDTSKYKNFLMSGSYIRPFEVSLATTINF